MALVQQRMTLDEFLAWEDLQPERHEFFSGEVFAMVAGRRIHERVIGNLSRRLGCRSSQARNSSSVIFCCTRAMITPPICDCGPAGSSLGHRRVTARWCQPTPTRTVKWNALPARRQPKTAAA